MTVRTLKLNSNLDCLPLTSKLNTVHENGHVLLSRSKGPGVWCNRCRKYTSNLRHVRLKITKVRCKQENGPELSSEGFLRSENRLDALEHELNTPLQYSRACFVVEPPIREGCKCSGPANAPDEGHLQCFRAHDAFKTQQVKVLRRVNSKTPISHLQQVLEAQPMPEASSGSADIPNAVFDRVGIGSCFSGLESGRYQRLYPYKNQLLRSSWASGAYMLLHAVCMPEVKRSGGVRQCTHDLDDFFCEFSLKLQTGHFGLLSFLLWAMTRKEFNRMMHSLFGNSATAMSYNSVASLHSKGKGKGKTQMSATMSVQQSEQDFLASVRDALPEAAKLRSQTTLLQSEWDVEVVPHQQLGPSGGVAVVPKISLPDTLRRVGYTAKPTAAVITQTPDDVGLLG